MLEELGLGEAVSQEEADVLVFNTCTIREKPDQRLRRAPGNAKMLKLRRPREGDRRRRLLRRGAARAALRPLPVRGRRVRPGHDPAPGRVARRGRAGSAQQLRDRRGARVRRHAADAPRAPLPGLGAGLDGLQLGLLVLHRARGPRARGEPPAGGDPRRGDEARRRGRARDHAARPERQLLGPRSPPGREDRVRRAASRLRRGRRHRAHPLHQPAPEGLPPRGDRRDGRVRRRLRARAPAAPVGLDADPQGDAPHVRRASATCGSSTSCARRSPISR